MTRIDMGRAKEILRLKELGFAYRDIALSVGCGKTVVGDTIRRAGEAGITGEGEDAYTEAELEEALYPEKHAKGSDPDEPDMAYLIKELSRKHVTRQLLWEEYKAERPNGLMYTQFCERIRLALRANDIDYHKTHNGGEECEVDWAGTTILYQAAASKEAKEAYLFVAVLPASAYPFVYAYPDRKTENWIDAHVRAFRFFGGTPRILVPDCTATAVASTDLYDPIITKTYYEMAAHYDITVVPARPYRPRDKNHVENSVGNASRRIIAPLRDMRFTDVDGINRAVADKLLAFIDQPFKKLAGCRRTAFEQIDKPLLRPLPRAQYELARFKECKIGVNYHVECDGFMYSVPYAYRGMECSVRATASTIEVFVRGERVCAHIRHRGGNRYVTLPEHLPEQHKAVSGWNDERFIGKAKEYGIFTETYIRAILASTEHSVQAYRACMGVFRQAGGLPAGVVEAACAAALENQQLSSRYFGLAAKQAALAAAKAGDEGAGAARVVQHGNIRGASAFAGGGRNA